MADEIYSSSYWGNGVCDNDIGWGGVYKDVAGCTPAFSSTNSMALDGVNDEISLGSLQINTDEAWSVSLWANLNAFSATYPGVFTLKTDESQGFCCFFSQSGSYKGINFGANTTFGNIKTDGDISASLVGAWNNIILTYNGGGKNTLSNYSIYVNGSSVTAVASGAFGTVGNVCVIGTVSQHFNGNIDEFAVFQGTELTSGNATSIYNSGVPAGLSSLNPTAWIRMGENGSYKSPQWLLPSNSNKDKFSNYSFEFDGVDDCIDPNFTTGTNDVSISFWMKSSTAVNYNDIRIAFGARPTVGGTTYTIGRTRSQFATPTQLNAEINGTFGSTVLNDGNWHNLVYTLDFTTKEVKAYVDGNTTPEATSTFPSWISNFQPFIGALPTLSNFINGNVDECAIWYSVLTTSDVTTIYNSGEPTTLPSGAIAHYKMGEDATFSTNWTVPDAVGSADGTSANMTIEDRVGEAPNSTNNSVSFNMLEADRETNVPS